MAKSVASLFLQCNDTYASLSGELVVFSRSIQDSSQTLVLFLTSPGSVPTAPYGSKGGNVISGVNVSGLCLQVTEDRGVSPEAICFGHSIVVALFGRDGIHG